MVESDRGIHLVQIADVMVDVRKMATTRPRNKIGIGGDGILGGALSRTNQPDLTYSMETMGCQMNQADSERMEGQLQALGIRPLPRR
jgi:hypothetical protein